MSRQEVSNLQRGTQHVAISENGYTGSLSAEHVSFWLTQKIPLIASREGWKEKPIRPQKPELLVGLGPFSDYHTIYTSSIYNGEHTNSPYPEGLFPDSMLSLQVRESVADQLQDAQSSLPKGMHLIVLDAYRTNPLQQQLYDAFRGSLQVKYPDLSQKELTTETEKFVTAPSADKFVSPHNTGGAVDVAIVTLDEKTEQEIERIDRELTILPKSSLSWKELQRTKMDLIHEHGTALDFGTPIDHGGKKAQLRYYEELAEKKGEDRLTENEKTVLINRRILYNVMKHAGFEPFSDEWWHYNSRKIQMGAQTAGIAVAEFGSADEFVDRDHEQTRKDERHSSYAGAAGSVNRFSLFDDARTSAMAIGSIRLANLGSLRRERLPVVDVLAPDE